MPHIHIHATPPNLATLTIANSIASMPDPLYKAGDIVIIPSARFAVVIAAIPSPDFTRWVYMVQAKATSSSYEYFNVEDLIEYEGRSN